MQLRRQGIGLAYEEAGTGEPAIVLVHGWGADREVLRPLFDWAAPSRRVVAVDLRGFGASDAPVQAYPIEEYAEDLAFLTAELGLRAPVVIGHSMGALVALDFAARHPTEASAAILLEPMALAPELLDGLRPILAGVRGDGWRDVVAGLMTYLAGPDMDSRVHARLVSGVRACHQHVVCAAMEGILAFDSAAAAALVTCPLLYVGTSALYADLERFRALSPQLETAELPGCGHYFPLEAPARLIEVVARFIERQSRGGPPQAR